MIELIFKTSNRGLEIIGKLSPINLDYCVERDESYIAYYDYKTSELKTTNIHMIVEQNDNVRDYLKLHHADYLL